MRTEQRSGIIELYNCMNLRGESSELTFYDEINSGTVNEIRRAIMKATSSIENHDLQFKG
jgi:hypothetical protein